jgi:hypothetical protein
MKSKYYYNAWYLKVLCLLIAVFVALGMIISLMSNKASMDHHKMRSPTIIMLEPTIDPPLRQTSRGLAGIGSPSLVKEAAAVSIKPIHSSDNDQKLDHIESHLNTLSSDLKEIRRKSKILILRSKRVKRMRAKRKRRKRGSK